jgi:hypothetical protein
MEQSRLTWGGKKREASNRRSLVGIREYRADDRREERDMRSTNKAIKHREEHDERERSRRIDPEELGQGRQE